MTNRSEQLSEKLRKLEYPSESGRMFDEVAPCADPEVADANTELVDELENILRGEAGENPATTENDMPQHFLFADAAPEDFTQDRDTGEPTPFALATDGDAAWGDTDGSWADEAADGDADAPGFDPESGLPKTRYGSPTPKFWDGDDLTHGLEEEEDSRPRLTRPRDVVTVALLLLLVGGGATFSAIQLTRSPVMVASTEGEAPEFAAADATAVAEAAVASDPADANAATSEQTAPDGAILPDPVIVDAYDAPPIGVDQSAGDVADAADDDPALDAVVDEPRIAALDQGPGPAPGGNDPGATANPAPAAANGGAPIMAFANPGIGGPMVADPLAVLNAPEGGDAPGVTTTAVANSWVNMRAAPDNSAAVITVVAEGAAVGIIECDGWCNVVVDGVDGWIYQSFLNR